MAMIRRLRTPLLAITPLALVVVLLIALLPGQSTRSLPGCDNPDVSALNQYCDPVPASTGPRAPQAGQPALEIELGKRVVDRIERSKGAMRLARLALLKLPASAPRYRTGSDLRVQTAGIAAFSAPLIAALAGLTLAFVGGALAKRWWPRRSR